VVPGRTAVLASGPAPTSPGPGRAAAAVPGTALHRSAPGRTAGLVTAAAGPGAPADRAGSAVLPSRPARTAGAAGTARVAAAGWGAVVTVGIVVGTGWVAHRDGLALRAAPLSGTWSPHVGPAWLPAVAVGVAAVAAGPRLAATLRWRALVATAAASTAAWATALAAGRGWSAVSAPLATRFEYLAVVPRIDGPGDFLRTFTERLAGYPTHVRGHPPGVPLAFWALDRLHLQGPGWAAALVIAGAAVATAATLVTVRSVTGEQSARRAAPFVALAPAALWLGTSADALIAGVACGGIALVVAGRRPLAHVAGGAVLGLALLCTYGAVPLLAVPLAVGAVRRDLRPAGRAAAGLAVVIALAAAAGFWWLGGLAATRGHYREGVAAVRPYDLFTFVLNPAALALATGPAAAAGLALAARRAVGDARASWAAAGPAVRRRPAIAPRTAVLPVAAALAVAAADASGLSKGEVERIWLPFVPWLLAGAATLGNRRGWLAAQVALALVLAVWLDSPW
jgi:hypothetical protein